MEAAKERFEQWCIVEVFGHSSYAGLVTEFQIAGAALIRVDVPAVESVQPSFSKLFGPSAIYCLTPTTREACVEFTQRNRTKPLASVDLVPARVPALPNFVPPEYDANHDD